MEDGSGDDDGDDDEKGEESQKITLKEVLDLLGFSEVNGLLAFVVHDQRVSTMGQQDLDNLNVSFLTGPHQGCHGKAVLEVKITSQTNQTVNDRDVTVEAGKHQGRGAMHILVVDVGPGYQQSVHGPQMTAH